MRENNSAGEGGERPRQRQRAAADPPMRARPPVPATGPPAPRVVQFDAHGRPVLRGHSPTTQDRLVVTWLTTHGHPEAASMAGSARAGPLQNLWERTSFARHARAARPAHDNRRGRERAGGAAIRRQRLRAHPRGHRKARNGEAGVRAMLAYEPAAHAAAQYVDLGCLGDRVCTHCGALLWAGEAVRIPAGRDRTDGTGWRGTLCCCSGTVHVEPVERAPAIDALFEDPRAAKDLVKHGRRWACREPRVAACLSCCVPEPALSPSDRVWPCVLRAFAV